MVHRLTAQRDEVVARADRALEAAWPDRKSTEFVRTMQWAVDELTSIVGQLKALGFDQVEQSRTYRMLGSLYADLAPALGKSMLMKAVDAYRTAERLLEGQSDALEAAKLDFNHANALRLIDANDIERLAEAKGRALRARRHFAAHEPKYLSQCDSLLQAIDGLIRIAPLAAEVQRNATEVEELRKRLIAGDDIGNVAEKMKELLGRGGGVAGQLGRLTALVDTLPAELRQRPEFAAVRRQLEALSAKALQGEQLEPDEAKIVSALRTRLEGDTASGTISREHAESLTQALDSFVQALGQHDDDLASLAGKTQAMREALGRFMEFAHYLSHDGLDRPPAGSRAAELVELNWLLRRYLMEELARAEKGEAESKEALDLSVRASRVDRRIYEAGANDGVAATVEKGALRPLALAVRDFSSRNRSMPAQPVWGGASLPVDPNAVFVSAPLTHADTIVSACRRAGLVPQTVPTGEGFASIRWRQLRTAMSAVFDLRCTTDAELASVCYELGIALTLGTPIVVLVAAGQRMPFDINVVPLELHDRADEEAALAAALSRSVVWTHPHSDDDAWTRTIDFVQSTTPVAGNIYVDQTLRLLGEQRKKPDPLAARRILGKLYDYLRDGKTLIVHPRWVPAYPAAGQTRLFHVMPYRPAWAREVTTFLRGVCDLAGAAYVRGDEMRQPDVILSIWDEIAQATHVLVDLTGLNANVALELGIANTLGRPVLMVGQDDTAERLFPSIEKRRLKPYRLAALETTLGSTLRAFLAD